MSVESAVLVSEMRIMTGWLHRLRTSERSGYAPGCAR